MQMRSIALSIVFLCIACFPIIAQSNLLQSGPMVGYSTMREVALWVQTNQAAKVKFVYWDQAVPQRKYQTQEIITEENKAFTAQLLAGQLLPGKKYSYELHINGKPVKRPYPLEFQSQTLWQWRTDPPAFRFALGSCAYINEPEFDRPGKPYGGEYDIFMSIHQQRPDFMLWLGDNTYLREVDWDTRSGIMHRYTHTRSTPEMQALLGSTHHFAIWDDHDFGPDNSDRSFWQKETALEAFKLFWPNPNYVLSKGTTGTFHWGDAQFFLLDDRFFKTPNENFIEKRTLLGASQIQWLIDALIYSKATFKFVAIGNQVLNPVELADSYSYYESEKAYILEAIREANVSGVIFLTGDRHHTELTRLDRPGTYPLYDLTVSPLTSGVHDPKNEANYLRVPNTLIVERNYALMEISGPQQERTLTLRVMSVQGKELWKKLLKSSELK